MPLLFVIAGAGMWFAAQRRSGSRLLGERTLRLLLPAAAGMFIIVPPQVFAERVARGEWQGGYLDFLVQRVLRFQPYPAGDFSWHHLWFIVYLYAYVLLLVPFVRWWRAERVLCDRCGRRQQTCRDADRKTQKATRICSRPLPPSTTASRTTHRLNLPKSSGRRFSRYCFSCSAFNSSAVFAASYGSSDSSTSSPSTDVSSESCA